MEDTRIILRRGNRVDLEWVGMGTAWIRKGRREGVQGEITRIGDHLGEVMQKPSAVRIPRNLQV